MKRRIKIDSILLFLIVVLTAVFYRFHSLYPKSIYLDYVLDFMGLQGILTGVFLRMSARGHKKARSDEGQELVTSGPYLLVRNPMYLGSLLIGMGFVFTVWPWFFIGFFLVFFYQRFNRQVMKEEDHLHRSFGRAYEAYAQNVPRFLPGLSQLKKIKFKEIFPISDIWRTQEKRGLFLLPFSALGVDIIREWLVFGFIDWRRPLFIFAFSAMVFGIVVRVLYRIDEE